MAKNLPQPNRKRPLDILMGLYNSIAIRLIE